jgi:FOG: TPR repeat, SEL1 subfamily
MYANGRGVDQDFTKAAIWYRKTADQGLDDAQYGLAHSYNYGNGLKQDFRLAINWYQKAADQDHAPAQYSLAQLYANGIGVERDHEKAKKRKNYLTNQLIRGIHMQWMP